MTNDEGQTMEAERRDEPRPKGPADFAELWSPDGGNSSHGGPEGLLLRSGEITAQQLADATQRCCEKPHLTRIDALLEIKAIEQVEAYMAVAEYFGLPFARITHEEVDPLLVERLNLQYATSKNILPIRFLDRL